MPVTVKMDTGRCAAAQPISLSSGGWWSQVRPEGLLSKGQVRNNYIDYIIDAEMARSKSDNYELGVRTSLLKA